MEWNKDHFQDDVCKCGHTYHRHFDSYEDMAPIGCKYCPCDTFESRGISRDMLAQSHAEDTCCVCGKKSYGSSYTCRDHQMNYMGGFGPVVPLMDPELYEVLAAFLQAQEERDKIYAAVKKHHDQRGDDRCKYYDDLLYFEVLGVGVDPYASALPPTDCMLESCCRYIEQRRHPDIDVSLPDNMTIVQLTEEVKRLREESR